MKGYWGPLNPKPYRPLIGTLKATLKDLLKGILGSLGGPLKDMSAPSGHALSICRRLKCKPSATPEPTNPKPKPFPKALRTHISRLLGLKTILYKVFGPF